MIEIISIFSDWPLRSLLIGAGAFFSLMIFLEIGFRILNRMMKNRLSPNMKILRTFLWFELAALFFFIIETPGGPLFPWNILYRTVIYLFAGMGLLFPLFMIIDKAVKYEQGRIVKKHLLNEFMTSSRRGIKATLLIMALSLLIWKVLDFIPDDYKNSRWFGAVILSNGILISILVLLVVRKTLRSSIQSLEKKAESNKISIILNALIFPLQLVVPIITLSWLNTIYGDKSVLTQILNKSIQLLLLTSVFVFTYRIVEIIGLRLSRMSEEETNLLDKTFIELMRMIFRIVLVFFGAFGIIRIVTGKPLTTLLAGLGIGGLALALAAQDTLRNFFGSLMIMTDKPFKIGERIQIKNYDGVVEEIGFRSTRIRTLVGHQVIIPNDQMASESVENIGRRPHIRRKTDITLTYSTGPEKMEKALTIIRNILDNHEGMTEDFPPRVYFNEYNPDSLNIIVLYWYSPPDYWKFLEFSERVNLEIMREFYKEDIEFAFPTNTTYLEQPEGKSIRMEWDRKDS